MKFQIVSDSSCDLPKERAQELGVDIVPFYVSFEEENYMKEGVDISVFLPDDGGPGRNIPQDFDAFGSGLCRCV